MPHVAFSPAKKVRNICARLVTFLRNLWRDA